MSSVVSLFDLSFEELNGPSLGYLHIKPLFFKNCLLKAASTIMVGSAEPIIEDKAS